MFTDFQNRKQTPYSINNLIIVKNPVSVKAKQGFYFMYVNVSLILITKSVIYLCDRYFGHRPAVRPGKKEKKKTTYKIVSGL